MRVHKIHNTPLLSLLILMTYMPETVNDNKLDSYPNNKGIL